ncbi:hypothetical protein [Niveibacterium umoris]|nr:hypothetical protein [Niveibacterium umoris]
MTQLTLAAHYGMTVEIDHCAQCRLLWFDQMETANLARDGLLALFRLIAAAEPTAEKPLNDVLRCPRCTGLLDRIHNMSRYGRMIHHRCRSAHGHAVTHAQFLAEKGLLRNVTEADLAQPAQRLLALSCRQCGAPLNALKDCNCPYCSAPVVMLDLERAVAVLADHDRRRHDLEAREAADRDAAFEHLMAALNGQ